MHLSHDLFHDLGRLSTYQGAVELENVLNAACEGKRDDVSNRKYTILRDWVRDIPQLRIVTPEMVVRNHDLGAFWSYIKSVSEQWEPRRQHVRDEFRDFLTAAEALPETSPEVSSSAWTGTKNPKEEAAAAKVLLPVAQAAIEALIDHLERGRGNGGPPLDDHKEALEALKGLHAALGGLIVAYEKTETPAASIKQEVVDYLGRAAKAMKDDPMPFAFSALCMAVCAGAGLPTVAAWLGAATMVIRKQERLTP